MRIISNGIDFVLPSGFAAEFTRNNVLLTDAGEQTAPITLPPDPINLKLVENADRMDNYYKPLSDLTVLVIDGLFHRTCNMGIHTANKKEGISATLYFASGEFYSMIDEQKLSSLSWPIWKHADWSLSSLHVQYLIDILKAEYSTPTTESIFGIRPVVTTQEYKWRMNKKQSDGSFIDVDVTGLMILNSFEKNQVFVDLSDNDYLDRFEGEFTQRLVVDSAVVNLGLGYGMTPFLKLRYVINFIFTSFGYQTDFSELEALSPRFHDKTLLINNVADAIYGGVLNFSQLVPNVTIKAFLEEFEKTYCGKFLVDFTSNKVRFLLYEQQLNKDVDLDLLNYICDEPKLRATEFSIVKIEDKNDKTSVIDSDKNITTISFELLKQSGIADLYRVNVDTFSKQFMIGMIQIAEIIHLNSEIVIDGKPVVEKVDQSSSIQLISVDDTWDELSVNVLSPYGYKIVYYKTSKYLFYNEFRDEFDNPIPPIYAIRSFYKSFIEFKLNSNIPIDVEMNIPDSVLTAANIYVPKLLYNQPVMIESIKYPLGKSGTQTVTVRTLRKYADR